MTDTTILESFKSDLELRNQSDDTIKIDIWSANQFINFLGDKQLNQTSKDDLKRYLAHLRSRKLKPLSLNRIFSCLSVFYDFLVEEGIVDTNLVKPVIKKYLRGYKQEQNERRIISVKEAINLVNSIIDTRDKTMVLLLLKTGIRRKELVALDVDDINLKDQSIELKRTAKRSNRVLFLDQETSAQLRRWLHTREAWVAPDETALFVNRRGLRLEGKYIHKKVLRYATLVGLHNPKSKKNSERFTPHCCRHFATTHLLRAGMRRDYVKFLRGDVTKEAIDIYYHIDPEDVRTEYLQYVPRFGV